jgi:hypothetical protein
MAAKGLHARHIKIIAQESDIRFLSLDGHCDLRSLKVVPKVRVELTRVAPLVFKSDASRLD